MEEQLCDNRHATLTYHNVDITISRGRWDIYITIKMPNGKTEEFVASADSFFTEQDEIWFGTKKEHQSYLER